MSTPSFLLHPLIYLVLQKSTIIVLLAFTSPKSLIRPSLFPILVVCNYHLLYSYTQFIPRSTWIGFISGEILTGILSYLEKLLLSKWSFEDNGPVHKETEPQRSEGRTNPSDKHHLIPNAPFTIPSRILGRDTIWTRLKFGTWVAESYRYIATPYQARNTPPYSISHPTYMPSRHAFLLRRGTVSLTCYLAVDLLLLGNQPALNPVIYAPEHVPFFPRLRTHNLLPNEILTRVSTTLGFWIGAYLTIQCYYSTTAFLAVAFGFLTPADRRPTFGSPTDAYTIRRFWGVFWHQLMRKKFTTIARWLTFDILGLPRKYGILTRYVQLLLAFLISGVLHQAIELAQGIRWQESGAVEFYVLMAGGIMLEDWMMWVWGKRSNQGEEEERGPLRWWQKVVGYVWVALFFSWTTPVWAYPQLRRNTGAVSDCPLPFSVIGWVTRWVQEGS